MSARGKVEEIVLVPAVAGFRRINNCEWIPNLVWNDGMAKENLYQVQGDRGWLFEIETSPLQGSTL